MMIGVKLIRKYVNLRRNVFMSTEYWAIQGIGLKLKKFDWKKCLGFIKTNFELDPEDIDEVTEETFKEFLDSTEIYYEGL